MLYVVHGLIGMLIAFAASLPLGPVNLAVIQTALNKGRNAAWRMAGGSALTEMLYCLVAAYGTSLFFATPEVKVQFLMYLKIASIPLLTALGLYDLGKKIERPQYVDISEQIPARARGQGSFWIGFSLNLLNPALLPFWLGITSYLHANDWLINEGPQLAMYVLGAGIGTLLVMSTIAYFALRRKKAMRYRTRVYLTRIIGFAFLGFGVFQSYEISRQLLKGILQDLAETGWGQVLLQLLS